MWLCGAPVLVLNKTCCRKHQWRPFGAPLVERIERRISDPLYGAGGGFPLRPYDTHFPRELPRELTPTTLRYLS